MAVENSHDFEDTGVFLHSSWKLVAGWPWYDNKVSTEKFESTARSLSV